MSINLISAVSNGARLVTDAEKDAQQKAAEANASSAFASLLSQTGATSDVSMVSGRPGNVVIPAILIDAGAEDAAPGAMGEFDETYKIKDVTDTFLDFARKSPAEQMRAMVLAELGLTEESLQGLDADARAEIEEKIRTRIEAKVRQGIEEGSGVKVSAASSGLAPI
jgi:N-acetylmuramoyl-L-alanine amidase